MSVVPAGAFTRIDVTRHGWANYRLVGYTIIQVPGRAPDDEPWGWDLAGSYLTSRSAERAARRILRRQQRPLTISTVTQETR